MKILPFLILGSLLLQGCDHTFSHRNDPDSKFPFGSGEIYLLIVFEELLGETSLIDSKGWSGHSNPKEFALDTRLLIKESYQEEIFSKLQKAINKLPEGRGWKNRSSGSGHQEHLHVGYQEDGHQYYFDFFLTQEGNDVRLRILHKGVKL